MIVMVAVICFIILKQYVAILATILIYSRLTNAMPVLVHGQMLHLRTYLNISIICESVASLD